MITVNHGIKLDHSDQEGKDFVACVIAEDDSSVGTVHFSKDEMDAFMETLPEDDDGKDKWHTEMYAKFPGITTTMISLMSMNMYNLASQNIMFYLLMNGTIEKWSEVSGLSMRDFEAMVSAFLLFDFSKNPLAMIANMVGGEG
jgi:hypothetical protein